MITEIDNSLMNAHVGRYFIKIDVKYLDVTFDADL